MLVAINCLLVFNGSNKSIFVSNSEVMSIKLIVNFTSL